VSAGPHNEGVIKLALAGFLALVLLAGLSLYWITPSTQLVDASGAELTTGLATAEVASAEPELFNGEEFREIKRLMDSGNHRPAKEQLVALLESSERDGEACILLSECCRELAEQDEAVDYGLKAIELLPDVGRAHHTYAKALADKMVKGENKLVAMMLLPKWKGELATAIELDPGNVDARLEQLTFFTYLPSVVGGDLDRAIELCAELEEYEPARGKLWMALAYQRKDEPERALQLCQEGLEAFPENGMFACTLGSIRAEQGRFDDADAAFEQAKQAGRGEAYYRTLITQANMHVDHELDREKAVALMTEYLAYHPDIPLMPPNAMVLFKQGQALEQLDKTDDARTAYEKCLQEDPRHPQAQDALDALDPADG
jgi:tetratricopeptide (TPR) repeat protein